MAKLPLLNQIISLKQTNKQKKNPLKSSMSMSGYSRAFLVFSALFLLLATQAPDNASWYKEDDGPKDKGESFHEV